MNSKRLLAIASFIEKKDKIIDVGCDHAYLGIYLKQNNLCSDILVTDVRLSALNNGINNIKKYNLDIDTKLTDGLNNIDLNKYNTLSISGMGTTTIKNILSINDLNIDKIILQSNNNLKELRIFMNKLGYTLVDELCVEENNIYYIIMKYIKGFEIINDEVLEYGLNKKDKKEYYNYLIDNYKLILNQMPKNKHNNIKNKIELLRKLLKESR